MKKILSILCALCLIFGMVPVMAVAAADDGDLHLNFNSTDWSGNTEQITEAGRFYSIGNKGSTTKVTLTYKTPLSFGSDNFAVTTYIHALSSNSNRFNEYNSFKIGYLELREYNDETKNDKGEEVGIYTLKLFYNGNELAHANMSSPNHFYTLVKIDGQIRVKLDNAYIKLTDNNGNKVDGVSASGMSFTNCAASVTLYSNYYSGRYAYGFVVDKLYSDTINTTDVSYPHESLYIIDPEDENSVVTYMNTAYSIPTGTDNKVVKYNSNGTYFDSDIWQAVPMINQKLIDRGYLEGGEACQAINSVVTSSDGKLAMFGTDIAGIYRSLDGGDHWQSCTIGLAAGGAAGIAIDPKNSDHVIIVGSNTGAAKSNGLFVTLDATDQCEWTQTLYASDISGGSTAISTHSDHRIQIVYDLNSYDAQKGYCMTAYWSVENKIINTDRDQRAMWKTTDGGFSWTKLENAVGTIYVDGVAQESSAFLAGAEMASYTVGGTFYMYAATKEGFYLSTDGGKNWTETLNSYGVYANAVDVIETEVKNHDADGVGKVWITTNSALYRSDDFGYTWSAIDGVFYPVYSSSYGGYTPDNISVSSLNSDKIYVTQRNVNGSGWFSHNGGKSWTKSNQNIGQKDTWQPVSGVSPFGYWSNIHENTLFVDSNGMWKSIDGGATLKWSNSGYNAIAITGSWNFNVNDSNLIALSAQDYNGGFSTDGGKTWTYLSWYGRSWGGHTYGAYILNEKTIIVCDSESWNGPRYLWITRDGGKTYENTGLLVKGHTAGMGALGNNDVAFMGEWRTDDGGKTWSKMVYNAATGSLGCNGVFALDHKTGTLFGAVQNRVVYSVDEGLTWHQIANAGASISDIAYDWQTGRIYVTAANYLFSGIIDFNKIDNPLTTIKYITEAGNKYAACSVAIDPNNPQVVYVGGNGDINFTSYDHGGVYRSLDRGQTWTCITRQVGDGRDMSPDGGKKATRMRVNANTGELFVACGCRGMWKIDPPPQWYLDANADGNGGADTPAADDELLDEVKKDLVEAGKYTNPDYTPKTVELELISRSAGVENGYFKVPDGVTIYVGDHIKFNCSYSGSWTMPNGNSYSSLPINTTTIKGNWSYNAQVCSNHKGYHSFSTPGYYTIYTISSSDSSASGFALVSFYVADPNASYTEISTEEQLADIRSNPNGNYILTADINLTFDWITLDEFNGLIYGNGHKISGLTAPFIGTNNGAISNVEFEGSVAGSGMIATVNNSYIANCKVSGSVSGAKVGGVTSVNSGIIKGCVVDATVTGEGAGAIAGENAYEITEETVTEIVDEEEVTTTVTTTTIIGSIVGCYYQSGANVIGSGLLDEANINYTFTDANDASQFANLDDNWYLADNAAPVLRVELGYTDTTLEDCFEGYLIKDGYLYIDSLDVTVDSLMGERTFKEATFGAYAPNGTALEGSKTVNTGDCFRLSWKCGDQALKVVIVADLNGNGTVTSAGYEKLVLHTLDITPLDGAFEMAADLDGDGRVTSADQLIYRQALLGLVDLLK